MGLVKSLLVIVNFTILIWLLTLLLLVGNGCSKEIAQSSSTQGGGGVSTRRGNSTAPSKSSIIVAAAAAATETTTSTSLFLKNLVTMNPKPQFKGRESNCAWAFDPCYFPRSTCCKWQSNCPYYMTKDDCNKQKLKKDVSDLDDDSSDSEEYDKEFCCKYL